MKRLACLLWVSACGFTGSQPVADTPDAAPDAPDVARICVSSHVAFCVDAPPAEQKTFTGTTLIDTASSQECQAISPTKGGELCIVFAKNITIDTGAEVRAFGTRPLVLIALDTLTIRGKLNVSSSRTRATEPGAGSRTCMHAQTPSNDTGGGGGGAGGSMGAKGGDGGEGDNDGGGTDDPGLAGDTTAAVTAALLGGCRGQQGGNGLTNNAGGLGGFGGGVVYLYGKAITLANSGSIHASGAAGNGGAREAGAGGGGSGGTIALYTPTLSLLGMLLAGGGAGGEGGQASANGFPGNEPTNTSAVPEGGRGATIGGGNGGNGGLSDVGSPGIDGNAGGGGGGGSAGHIVYFGPALAPGTVIDSAPLLARFEPLPL